ncbi:MAG: fatty acid desaturase [Acidobacteria bacterium]|nr:fatty acid desaturase [Acidobacteriota bacterium]
MVRALLRHSSRDTWLVAVAAGQGALLVSLPSAPLVGIGLWWNANTVAHNFVHRPFFRTRPANALFSAYLSVLLGVPHTLWRDRHLAHHAGRAWRLQWSGQLAFEAVVVTALWVVVAAGGLLAMWLTGWLAGLLLCALQGHYEHAHGVTSHYGALYNLAFFNDGYHVEHHAHPGQHWSELGRYRQAGARSSRWPPVLRWLELFTLDGLERLVLHSRHLQQFVVERHARAFSVILANLPPVRRVTIVGGGLFPRTALALRRCLPKAEITVVDRSPENLQRARPYLDERVRMVEASYSPDLCDRADLVVIPLSFTGDRRALYLDPPAPAVAVHDWIWRRRSTGTIVSVLLLKRLNLVRQTGRGERQRPASALRASAFAEATADGRRWGWGPTARMK